MKRPRHLPFVYLELDCGSLLLTLSWSVLRAQRADFLCWTSCPFFTSSFEFSGTTFAAMIWSRWQSRSTKQGNGGQWNQIQSKILDVGFCKYFSYESIVSFLRNWVKCGLDVKAAYVDKTVVPLDQIEQDACKGILEWSTAIEGIFPTSYVTFVTVEANMVAGGEFSHKCEVNSFINVRSSNNGWILITLCVSRLNICLILHSWPECVLSEALNFGPHWQAECQWTICMQCCDKYIVV